MRGHVDDRVLRDLGAGSGGRRDGDEGQGRALKRQAEAHELKMIQRTSRRGGERRHRLAEVDRGATAEGNHYPGLPGKRHGRLKHRQGRLLRARMRRDRNAPPAKPRHQPLCPPRVAAVHDEGALTQRGDFGQRRPRLAPAEADTGRLGDGEGRHTASVAATARFQRAYFACRVASAMPGSNRRSSAQARAKPSASG